MATATRARRDHVVKIYCRVNFCRPTATENLPLEIAVGGVNKKGQQKDNFRRHFS
jgi:hypothetical protein